MSQRLWFYCITLFVQECLLPTSAPVDVLLLHQRPTQIATSMQSLLQPYLVKLIAAVPLLPQDIVKMTVQKIYYRIVVVL